MAVLGNFLPQNIYYTDAHVINNDFSPGRS